jgi:hypothetical protein
LRFKKIILDFFEFGGQSFRRRANHRKLFGFVLFTSISRAVSTKVYISSPPFP